MLRLRGRPRSSRRELGCGRRGRRKRAGRMSADTEKKVALTNEKVIGNGSFGVVFQATLVETGENVAVKKVLQDKRFKVGT